MKLTLNITPAQIQGVKDYLREVCDIKNPTMEDVKTELEQRAHSAIFEDTQEALCGYIKEAEQAAK